MSTLVAQTISNGTVSTSSANVIQGSAKAWANYNGETQTVRASYNVSSITRSGLGNYTVNFTNAFADTNYLVIGTSFGGNPVTGQNYGLFGLKDANTANTKNTSSVQVTQGYVSGTGSQGALRDHPEIYFAVFR